MPLFTPSTYTPTHTQQFSLAQVFVYGIGRFLRLSMTNIRMRIPYEDLPNTRRLVALCQVSAAAGTGCAATGGPRPQGLIPASFNLNLVLCPTVLTVPPPSMSTGHLHCKGGGGARPGGGAVLGAH